ncbi:hypothetical protein [uncultured Thiodictyon sp.]|uniref:hypothetical protein n=1 Tax=uncultured Thiodictyon sp. TaxID=1846217 RepID=UPI0025D2FCB7|nr:hypothetical protein [uncultured Thiodictyon sp.]
MDLRAKIYGQLGYRLDAERCWVLAAKADPTNPLYPRALERLRRRTAPSSGLRRLGLVLTGGAALLLFVAQGLRYNDEIAALKQELATTSATNHKALADVVRRQEELAASQVRSVTDMRGAIAAVSDGLDGRLAGLTTRSDVTDGLARLASEINAGIKNQMAQTSAIAETSRAATRESQATWTKQHEELEMLRKDIQGVKARFESLLGGLTGQIERLGKEVKSQSGVGITTPANPLPNVLVQ